MLSVQHSFRIDPFLPIEVIAKVTLNENSFDDLLLENHFLRIVYDEKYVCKVQEEIICCDKETKEAVGVVAVIESAERDLD